MSKATEMILKYTAGKVTLEETNKALIEMEAGVFLDPEKNQLTQAEREKTIVDCFPHQVNGYGLLDTGTGSLDKVEIRNGRLVGCDCGKMPAQVFVAGKIYNVLGSVLVK